MKFSKSDPEFAKMITEFKKNHKKENLQNGYRK